MPGSWKAEIVDCETGYAYVRYLSGIDSRRGDKDPRMIAESEEIETSLQRYSNILAIKDARR